MTGSDAPPSHQQAPASRPRAAPDNGASRPALAGLAEPARRLLETLSRPEKLIFGGAVVITIVDLVFNILVRGYLVSDVLWAGAVALIAVGIAQRRTARGLAVPYRTLLVAIAGLAALVAARDVIEDVLHLLRPPLGADPAFVLGTFGVAVAAVLLGAGAWLLMTDRHEAG